MIFNVFWMTRQKSGSNLILVLNPLYSIYLCL
nr:MAG TPA: hypothetical protein [Caudoviricetes sp.]